MTINDRIAQLIESECNGNKRAFAKCVGIAATVVENIVGSRKTKPSFDVLEKIIFAFEDISIDWLVVGKGTAKRQPLDKKLLPELLPKLLLSEKKCTPECTPVENFNKKNVKVNVKGSVKAITKSPAVISSQRDVPTFQAREVQRGGIPLIPLEAAAGILSGTEVQIMDYECEHFVIPGFKNADFMIQITGDSMLPKYESGDVVACQRLPMSTFFQWNCVYVVDSEQGILIKRVKQGSDKEHIELVSENEKYGAFELHLGDINGLGRVVGLVRFE